MAEENSYLVCDGQQLKALAAAGLSWLEAHYRQVNELNVFPVPDGDTGTNMLLTMRNAFKEVAEATTTHAGHIAKTVAHGAMMGSRGNSGTIMSQLWLGFARVIGDVEMLDAEQLVKALRVATDTAYRGVQRPVEGTILTVAREMTEEAESLLESTQDLGEILTRMVARGWDAVERTPDMLPVLKDAGVVDSGGTGLVYMLEGMLRFTQGQPVEVEGASEADEFEITDEFDHLADVLDPGELGYGYDVQFVIKGDRLNPDTIKAAMESMGDSVVVVGSETAVKVHVHVHNPGIPVTYAANLGVLGDVVIENMQEQYEAYLEKKKTQSQNGQRPATESVSDLQLPIVEPGQIGIVAVAAGLGMAKVFQQLGVNALVNGGQTNNPSTEEILNAVERVNSDRVIVLPNNKNIILAAEQACRLAQNKQIVVIPTRSFPEGVSAMLPYLPEGDLDHMAEEMTAAKDDIITGEVTRAVRNVEIDGVKVTEGQCIGLLNGKLKSSGDNLEGIVQDLLDIADLDAMELVTLYYGDQQTNADAVLLAEKLAERYPGLAFEIVYGGQPHYQYVFSVE